MYTLNTLYIQEFRRIMNMESFGNVCANFSRDATASWVKMISESSDAPAEIDKCECEGSDRSADVSSVSTHDVAYCNEATIH